MRDLIALGSSSSEVFDYIFGNNPRYHPFWASGWSARGLRNGRTKDYVAHIMRDMPRDANILLNFGVVDVEFNSRHKSKDGYYDFPQFVREASQGIVSLRVQLAELGFISITAIFAAPPADLPRQYWIGIDGREPMPVGIRAAMMADLATMVSAQMPTINLLRTLSSNGPLPILAGEYMRVNGPDHHQNYISTQHIIYDALVGIEGMIPPRLPFLENIYQHVDIGIAQLVREGSTRRRTCA